MPERSSAPICAGPPGSRARLKYCGASWPAKLARRPYRRWADRWRTCWMDEWRLDKRRRLPARHSQGSERRCEGWAHIRHSQLEWDRGQMAQEAPEAQADKNWLSAAGGIRSRCAPVNVGDQSHLTLARMRSGARMMSVEHTGLLMDWCNQADAARISKTDFDQRHQKPWRPPSAFDIAPECIRS